MFQTKLMREFRNAAGKMIVVYDYDESVASRSATTLAQRGYDNVLMLSGGLRVAEIKFPSRDIVFSQVHPKDFGQTSRQCWLSCISI